MTFFPKKIKNKYESFLDILVTPDTKEALTLDDRSLTSLSGKTYQIINDIPILVTRVQEMNITRPKPEKISQNVLEYKVGCQHNNANRILHLGSGNVRCLDERVLSVDILPCENVDIVAEAERLPFANNSFDLVESGAVFEHLLDPIAAIKEVKRVLKPGGIFYIDNSYLQPYHGFPSNYFEMTPQANETYLVDDFILLQSEIPDSGTPLMTVFMMIERFLANTNSLIKKQLLAMTVADFLKSLRSDLSSGNTLLKDFSEHEKRSLAASHIIVAKKPMNYEERLNMIKMNKKHYDSWMSAKQQYYTMRTELMIRYHEIFLYKRLVSENEPLYILPKLQILSLSSILEKYLLNDPLDYRSIKVTLSEMLKEEIALKNIRDTYIKLYLETKNGR